MTETKTTDTEKQARKLERVKRQKIKAARDHHRRTCRKRRRKEKEATVGKTNFRG